MSDMSWSFGQIWNESLANREERIPKPRMNMWAGEIGGAYIDRYLKMQGVTPTNPPNARSLRKFEAGNLMEWVVELVLRRAGIYKSSQDWVSYTYPNLLEVTGKLDHMAGGAVDWAKAREEVKTLELPLFFNRATSAIIDNFAEKFPDGLREIIIEVKSCAAIQFDARERTKQPQPQHALQLFHYLKAKNLPEGHIVYICKDDLRMIEFGIFNPSPVEDLYRADIEKMTYYIKNKIEPEKEPFFNFDELEMRFTKNWKVEYSNYLTYLYGYERPDQFADEWKLKVSQFNRAFSRSLLVAMGAKTPTGKPIVLTPDNLKNVEEAKKYLPDWDKYIEIARKKGVEAEKLLEEVKSE